ncbi:hypothetical protein ACFL6F_02715 [Planctomycetota bacterium]
MRIRVIFTAAAVICALCAGCSAVVEEDGEPVGSRDSMIMVNPVGNAVNDLDYLFEFCFEQVNDTKNTSSFILGAGKDTENDNDTSAIYFLGSGRYYPIDGAPNGLFVNLDIGAGHYTYRNTDNTDVTFMYGMSVGYKIMFSGFIVDLGAGVLKTDFIEDDQSFTNILRLQVGMKF